MWRPTVAFAAAVLGLLGNLSAEPVVELIPAAETELASWSRKVNTAVGLDLQAEPSPVLSFTIDPEAFSYGWIHRVFPEADYAAADGLHGYYRCPEGSHGELISHVIIGGADPSAPSYFRSETGPLQASRGEWTEFYLPFRSYRHERGPVEGFAGAQLCDTDRIQFLASIGDRSPVTIELRDLAFLPSSDVAGLWRRMREARLRRMLLPATAADGPPHPRLLLTDAALPSLRAKARAGDDAQAVYERLLALAEAALTSVDPDDPFPDVLAYAGDAALTPHQQRAGFERTLVPRVTPIETLAAACRLTGDERFGRHAAEALVSMARSLTVHDAAIDHGFYYTRTFYVRALAFGYDWLWDLLTPEERCDVKTTLLGFVLDIHADSMSGGWGRRPLHRVWNWDPGLMGACGVGMLALEGETATGEMGILFDCRRHVRDYLGLGIDRDGCGHEGPSYIGYGIGAAVEFAEVLRQQGRGDLFEETNYRRIAPWLAMEMLPDGRRWNNLSDCGHGQAPWPVYVYALGRLAASWAPGRSWSGETRRASPSRVKPPGFLQAFRESPGHPVLSDGAPAALMSWVWHTGPGNRNASDYSGPHALAHVLFYQDCPKIRDPADALSLGMLFRGRGLAVSRTGFGSEDWHLAVEAGPHAAGHDQCDKGTFTLRAYGADLVIDSGYGNTGDPLGSGSSFAHNVVLIDGEGQPMRYHNQSSGFVTGYHHSDLADWIRVDASEAWGVRYDRDWVPSRTSPVERADRSLLFVRPSAGMPGYLVVWDDIVKDADEHDYTWQWHTPADRQFEVDGPTWRCVPATLDVGALSSTPERTSGEATFRFTVPRAGAYRIFGLTRAAGLDPGKSDSFFASVDGGPDLTWDTSPTGVFSWSPLRDRGEEEARRWDLDAGSHTVELRLRETQTELARLIVQPADADPPADPPADPAAVPGATVARTAADATMGKPPLDFRPPGTRMIESDVSLDVTMIQPSGGQVTTDWYETTREGAHPRLHYTVRSRRPDFLAVLVPRRPGAPPVATARLDVNRGVGVVVTSGETTDRILFARRSAEGGGLQMHASAALVRTVAGRVIRHAVYDGTALSVEGEGLQNHASPTIRVR